MRGSEVGVSMATPCLNAHLLIGQGVNRKLHLGKVTLAQGAKQLVFAGFVIGGARWGRRSALVTAGRALGVFPVTGGRVGAMRGHRWPLLHNPVLLERRERRVRSEQQKHANRNHKPRGVLSMLLDNTHTHALLFVVFKSGYV